MHAVGEQYSDSRFYSSLGARDRGQFKVVNSEDAGLAEPEPVIIGVFEWFWPGVLGLCESECHSRSQLRQRPECAYLLG